MRRARRLADSHAWTSTRRTPRASRGWRPARVPTAIADPRGERRGGARAGARVPRRRRRGRDLPRARADRLRDRRPAAAGHRCSTRSRRAIAEIVAARRDLRPVLVVGAPLRHRQPAAQLRGRDPPRAGCSASRRSPTCRPTASSTSAGSSRPATTARRDDHASAGVDGAVRPRPAVPRPTDVPGLVLHVEICEDMWVPVPPSAEAALAGATVLANLSGSPITVGRAPRTAGCWSARRRRAASRRTSTRRPAQGESSTDLSWDGQTMVYEIGELLAETERFPDGPAPVGRRRRPRRGSGRSGCGRARSTTTAAHARRAASALPHASSFELDAAGRRHRAAPQGRPLPVRARRRRAARAGLLRGLQHPGLRASSSGCARSASPKVVIGVSGGLDSTHALIVAAKAMDRLGRPRSDILAFTLPGLRDQRPAPSPTPPGSSKALGVTFEEIDISRRRRADARRPRPPVRATASRSTTSRSRTSRPGCAPTTCSGSPTTAAASCSAPATSPSWRSAGARTASATRCRTTPSTPACRRR